MNPLLLELPFPPSVNHYWRNYGRRTVLSKQAIRFRNAARCAVSNQLAGTMRRQISWPVAVAMRIHPPDRRRRDLDNMAKALLDCLTYCAVWTDDRLVHELHLHWGEVIKNGKAVIQIGELGGLGTNQ